MEHRRLFAGGCCFAAGGLADDGSLAWHRGLWIGHAAFCVAFFALLAVAVLLAHGLRRRQPGAAGDSPAEHADGSARWRRVPGAKRGRTCRPSICCRPMLARRAAGAWRSVPPPPPASRCGRARSCWESAAAIDAGPEASSSPTGWSDDAVWSCTTCAACNSVCPVGIDIYEKIVDLRRGRVEAGIVPDSAEQLFESVAEKSNPFGRPNADRLAWSQGLTVPVAAADEPIELLYWIGCAGSFRSRWAVGGQVDDQGAEPPGGQLPRARLPRTLHRRSGPPAGRRGLVPRAGGRHNLDTFRQHGVRKILTHCPHCWNTFRNEYPTLVDGDAGPAWTVQHHTEFLAEMIAAGRSAAAAPGGRADHLSRSVLSRSRQRRDGAAARGLAATLAAADRGNAPQSRAVVLLRGGWRRDVGGCAGPGARGASAGERGRCDGGQRRRDGLPVLQGHAADGPGGDHQLARPPCGMCRNSSSSRKGCSP